MTIIEDRLAILDNLVLESGGHEPDSRYCVMEAVAYIAGEPWSDSPECVSPVIGAFLRSWNDGLGHDDRQMLKPYITKVIATRTTKRDEEKRAWLATDWLARECAPAFLRCAGLTVQHAEKLEGLAPLTTSARARRAQPTLAAARAAAGDAARAAAGAALAPTVKLLQPSALLLLDRMIEVGEQRRKEN